MSPIGKDLIQFTQAYTITLMLQHLFIAYLSVILDATRLYDVLKKPMRTNICCSIVARLQTKRNDIKTQKKKEIKLNCILV